jgi:hypothetical protein
MLRKLISAALGRETGAGAIAREAPPSDGDVPSRDFPSQDLPPRDFPPRDFPSRDFPSQDLSLRDFPPMRPLEPPAAQNDNPLAALCEAVEADLRAAGYLR